MKNKIQGNYRKNSHKVPGYKCRRYIFNPPTTTSFKISQTVDILAKVYLLHLKVKHCQTSLDQALCGVFTEFCQWSPNGQ